MSKLKDAIYGFAIGDALGVPYEFMPRGTFNCHGMRGHGTWNQPAGTWSDDTSMTLATLDSIKNNGKIDLTSIMHSFLWWRYADDYTAGGKVFDVGHTTARALDKYMADSGLAPEACGGIDFYSNGNGSLMRMLPLAFVDCTDKEIRAVSSLTHAHEISTDICIEYVKLTRQLISTQNIYRTFEKEYYKYKDMPIDCVGSSGFVVDTFNVAKWAIINSNSYKDCVLKAVNLGGDTDTNAAIAGGWAGIIYGYNSIPLSWRLRLKNKKLIGRIINEN